MFLLNPNGIIFGPQASLNIGGAFFASTASRLIFADGSEFGKPAVNKGATLLTLSVPIGLQLDSQSASIDVRGATLQATGLTLVGSNIHLDGATLRSDGGAIYLGTSQISDLRLPIENQNPGLQSEISNSRSILGDIQLSNGSLINSSGSIQLQGRRIILTDGSTIVTATQNLPGGALTVMASELLELAGTTPDGQLPSALFTETQGAGVGGDVQITANRLIVRDGAQILTNTAGSGAGGNIVIRAAESAELAGESAHFPSGVFSQTEGTAGAGEITIDTNRLIVRDGAQANTNTFGTGNAGVLTVRATDSVELSGEGQAPSGLFAQADSEATGAGGNLTVETGRLLVRDGAQVSTSTFGSGTAGNLLVRAADSVELSGGGQQPSGLFAQVEPEATGAGGNLTVETGRLLVRDGAQVSSTTFGDKPARNLTVNASESVEVRGTTADGQTPSGLYSRSTTTAAAGSLYIVTDKLTIRNRGFIAVSNPDFGDAGIVDITANRLVVDRGSISAETAAGEGGNLFIQTENFQLRHNSSVTTTAGGTGNGGNITLATTNFVALENSDIRADAYAGNGGNIIISTRGLFRSPDSEITASSKLGVNGVVTIQTPDKDAAHNFVLLDSQPNNTEQLLANSCLANRNRKRGRFVVTGTGGLPSNPLDELNIQYDVMGVRELVAFEGGGKRVPLITNGRPPTPTQIVEANAVAIGPNGEVMLVAQAPDDLTPDVC
ncbi:S-layer family protein [Argonema galeatum A003/A1]|nr:S-layer family protein [Argonema galeatum A003/A1]